MLELIMFLTQCSDMRWQLRIGVRIPLSPPGSYNSSCIVRTKVCADARKNKLLKTKKQSAKDKKAKKPEMCLDPKTVRNSYLAAVKATLGYAKQQTEISKNVAAEVTVRVKKKQREKGFTEEEALAILMATRAPTPPGMSEEHAMARRWVLWICAYTGARVNEITQLLPSDFMVKKEVPYIRIDADAAKTGDYREVPPHDHLIEQGLIAYKESRGDCPLFYDPKCSRGGRDDGKHFRKTGERLAQWIRSEMVGVTDERVAPNHGWCHRFSSLARHVDMHADIQNIIQGHAGDKSLPITGTPGSRTRIARS